jgi:glycosyltransferase involved in cell wall biosynthesis
MKMNNRNTAKGLEDIFVSTVMVVRPEATGLTNYINGLYKLLSTTYTNFEIVVVDNGADSEEFKEVTKLLNTLPCIRLIRLSQNIKFDTALFAGLDVSIGDFVCTLDPETDPIDTIPKFVELNKQNDVVQGISKVPIKGVFGTQLGRKAFYWYNRKYIGIDIPLNATFHASYTRRAINSLTAQSGRHYRHVRHMARRIGFSYATLAYEPLNNPGSRRKLGTSVVEALEIVTSYSTHPLRFVTWLGVLAGTINVLYALYVLTLFLTGTNLAPGWTSTSMQLSLMFFILFIILIILSEYIGRILTETHRDPQYFIVDELTSTVAIADMDRKNITR